MKVLRDHDPEHMRKPVTAGEFKRVLKEIVTAMVVFGALVIIGLGLTLRVQADNTRQTRQLQDLVVAIQQSRFEATRDNCAETNARHDQTYLRLGSAQRPAGMSLRQFAKQLAYTRAIVDALAPRHDDCAAFSRARTSTPIPIPPS